MRHPRRLPDPERRIPPARSGRRHGVTLIETLVVLALLGILAVLGWSRLSRTGLRHAQATAAIANTFTEAKNIASDGGHDVIVVFDATRQQFRIHADRNNDGLVNEGEAVLYRSADPWCSTPRPGCDRPLWSGGATTLAGPDGEQFTEMQDDMPAAVIQGGT